MVRAQLELRREGKAHFTLWAYKRLLERNKSLEHYLLAKRRWNLWFFILLIPNLHISFLVHLFGLPVLEALSAYHDHRGFILPFIYLEPRWITEAKTPQVYLSIIMKISQEEIF